MKRQHSKVERGPECPAEMAEIRTERRTPGTQTDGSLPEDGLLFACTINARAAVKKNTQRVVGYGRKRRAIYSPQYKAFESVAILSMIKAHQGREPIDVPIEARFRFYFANHQWEADLSNLVEGPQDALKDAGVIADDRLIQSLHATKHFGDGPRVEIELRGIA